MTGNRTAETSSETRARGQRRNQNARKHGIFSTVNPLSLKKLAAIARQAKADGDWKTLDNVGYELQNRGKHERGKRLRRQARELKAQYVSIE